MINLTSRILNQPYFEYIEKVLNHIHTSGYELIDLVNLAINFVLTCGKGENKELFIEFIVNTKEIFIHTLVNIYSYGYKIILKKIEVGNNPYLQKMKNNYEKYNELINILVEKRNNFEKESILNLENDNSLYEDLLCVICYKQIANTQLKPCMHRGCKECILTYMLDNVKCFMCRQPIESVQTLSKEEIEKEKEKIKEKNKKNENDINSGGNKEIKEEENKDNENKDNTNNINTPNPDNNDDKNDDKNDSFDFSDEF